MVARAHEEAESGIKVTVGLADGTLVFLARILADFVSGVLDAASAAGVC